MLSNKGVQRQIVVAFIATLGAMTIGTILGWSSPAEKMLVSNGAATFYVGSAQLTTISSVLGMGAIFGAIPAGHVINALGHRCGMVLYELITIAGWVVLTVPQTVWMLYAGRCLHGIGIGALCTIIPPYVAEISVPQWRGKLGAMFQLFVTTGILYSYVFGSIMKYKYYNGVCGIWAVLHAAGVIFIPESPHYLLHKNKNDRATASMSKLRDGTEAEIQAELATLKAEFGKQKAQQKNAWKILTDRVNRKAMLIGVGCMFFQQASGINLVIFFMNSIFGKASGGGGGVDKMSNETSSIIIAVIQVFMTILSLSIIDKAGRRVLLIISAVMMCISLAGLVTCIMLKDNTNFKSSAIFAWLPLIVIAVYISAFSVGFGPVPWIVMGEIFSAEIKPLGTGIVTGTNWLMVFLITSFKMENVYINFIVSAVFCLLAVLFVWLVVPETRNKSLAAVQAELAGDAPAPTTSA